MCKVCGLEKNTFIKAPEASEVVKDVKPLTSKETLIEAEELHKPVIKKFVKGRIVTKGIDDLWAADLVIMDKYVKENDGYKYIFNVINTFSKYAWSEPLVRKSGKELLVYTKAFGIIIKRVICVGHKAPNLLHSDKSTEFENKELKGLLVEYGIKMYHTESEEKSAIVTLTVTSCKDC